MKVASLAVTIFVIALTWNQTYSQSNSKPRVYVIESDSWSNRSPFTGILLGSRGGASPQTAEIIKTFGERCKESIVNISRDNADYIVLLEHEGGKGLLRVDNKFAIFGKDGDAIRSGSTRSLGNSVQDACDALIRDWTERQNNPKPPAGQVKSDQDPVTTLPAFRPVTSLDLREASGTNSSSAVTFQSNPDGAEIEIDGKFSGNTPSQLQLIVGDHKIRIKRSGFESWERTISVIAGGNILVVAELERISPAISQPVPVDSSPQSNSNSSLQAPGTVRTGALGIDLVWIPPGDYIRGNPSGEGLEKPAHQVSISQGFWMGKYEVTQLQWFTAMGVNPSHFNKCGSNCPVERITWDDAQSFIAHLNARNDGFIYSLPTEAQWEYAARAGSTDLFAGELDDMGWYKKNSRGSTHPVGSKKANAFGLFDMHGNVWEWCEDRETRYSSSRAVDPIGSPTGSKRTLRGGSWLDQPKYVRSSQRVFKNPTFRYQDAGLRVVARLKQL